jgi:hypothetical protein
MKKAIQFTIKKGKALALPSTVYALTFLLPAQAQDGNAGINEATLRKRSYFANGTNLMYAIGALLGLVGAVKVYQKWNSGDPDTGKVAAAWFGSCVFLGHRGNCAEIIFRSVKSNKLFNRLLCISFS